ncbi:putative reverse transcriptase domain-containing protein [Tanacetum coccineum]
MPPRMRTRSAGRPAAESRGGGTGGRVGRGGGRGRRPKGGNDEQIDELNGQGNDQGMGANGGVEGIDGNVEGVNDQVGNQGNVENQNGNVVNENIQEKVRNVLVNSNRVGCSYKQFLACNRKEYDGKGGVVVLTQWIEKMEFVQDMSGCSINQKAGHAAYTDRFHELARLVPHLVTPESRKIKRYVYGLAPQIRRMVAAMEPKTMQKVVQIYGALTDEAVRNRSIKNVEKRGNVGNLARIRMGHGNQGNQARGRAFMLGAEEARQDPNIVTASGQLVEIEKVIKGCKLEIEGHVFDIDLIPFGHRSFDVIICMDWLSNHKAEIICHEKVVRIPLLDGKVLRVLKERPEEKVRLLMSTKARDKKQEEIVVVRDFFKVFLDDLSGLPPLREIEFRIELIPGAVPIAKSPYHLATSELEELSGQLNEL